MYVLHIWQFQFRWISSPQGILSRLSRDCSWLKFPEDMKALLAPLSPVSQLFCSLTIHLLNGGTVGDLIENFKKIIASYLTDSDVYPSVYMCYEVCHRDAPKMVQIRIITWFVLQLFHPRRLCCPQLETRCNLFICPMTTWGHTLPHTEHGEKQAGSNRGGFSTTGNQNGGNKVEAWFWDSPGRSWYHNCSAQLLSFLLVHPPERHLLRMSRKPTSLACIFVVNSHSVTHN